MRAVQNTVKKLYQYPLLNRDIWSRGEPQHLSSLFPSGEGEQSLHIKKQPLLALLYAHRRVFQRGKTSPASVLNQETAVLSLSECIQTIRHRLLSGTHLKMSELIGSKNSDSHTLITFLALLELGRLGIVSLKQKKEYSDIAISVQKQFNDKSFQLIQEM